MSGSGEKNKGDPARRRGRTPSINSETIEAAVRKVGRANQITMHGVASELEVNVTTLYRHTGGLDGLRRIYASQLSASVGEAPLPVGNWRQWLRALAEFYREAMCRHPDLLQFAQAALDPDFTRLEEATRVLVDYGFKPREAARAHAFLVNNVVGYVHQEMQTGAEISDGVAPTYSRLGEMLSEDAQRLPTLNGLHLEDSDLDIDANFRLFINYTIEGIAARRAQNVIKQSD